MNRTTGKFIAVVLMAGLLSLPAGLSAKQRRGAALIVTRLDGSQASGELVTVRPDSLLLLSEGTDLSVAFADVRSVRIVRRSHALLFAGIGGAAGATAGAIVGFYGGGSDDNPGPARLRGGLIFGALGALAGWLASSAFSGNSEFNVAEGRPETVVEFWDRLRPYSREGRLPGSRVSPGALQAGRPSLRTRPRFRIRAAASLVPSTEQIRLTEGTFRFREEAPPEAGPYPFVVENQQSHQDALAGTFSPVSLAFDWSDRWSAEVEGSLSPATMGSLDTALSFTSGLDGRDYFALFGESRAVRFTSLLAGLTYRLVPASAFLRHSLEAGVAAGPAFVRYTLYNETTVRKTILCGRIQAAYDFSLLPEVAIGVFAGYRIMRATFPGDVFSFFAEFKESGEVPGGTIERQTEITLPDLSVDGSGPFVGLRIGFRI
jgi:hypothetical protein